MIFVTVGTEKFPFDRLVRSIDRAVGEGRIRDKVYIQKGYSSYVPVNADYWNFLEFPDMVDMVQKANLIVSHAGVGSFLLCVHFRKVPILFPRRAVFGEHLDDHQLDFVKGIERLDVALVAYDERDLLIQIDHYRRLIARVRLGISLQTDNLVTYLAATADKIL